MIKKITLPMMPINTPLYQVELKLNEIIDAFDAVSRVPGETDARLASITDRIDAVGRSTSNRINLITKDIVRLKKEIKLMKNMASLRAAVDESASESSSLVPNDRRVNVRRTHTKIASVASRLRRTEISNGRRGDDSITVTQYPVNRRSEKQSPGRRKGDCVFVQALPPTPLFANEGGWDSKQYRK